MKKTLSSLITPVAVCAALGVPVCVLAQNNAMQNQKFIHHHYKLIDVGTLGGPASFPSGPGAQVLNNQGTFVAYANTATANPNANCAMVCARGRKFVTMIDFRHELRVSE